MKKEVEGPPEARSTDRSSGNAVREVSPPRAALGALCGLRLIAW